MATGYGVSPSRNGLVYYLNPISYEKSNLGGGLTYWEVSHGLGTHPTTEQQLDNLFTGSTLVSTGFHEGEVAWGSGNQGLRWGGNAASYPSYMTQTTNYGWLARGYLYAPVAGTYEFVADGDDALDVFINGTKVSSWYNGHGFGAGASTGTLTLGVGWYPFQARFEEIGGGDGIAVAWKKPGDGSFSTIPGNYYRPLGVSNLVKSSSTSKFGSINEIQEDNSISFNGTSDFFEIDDPDLHTSSQRTIEMVFKVNSIPYTYTPIATYTNSTSISTYKRFWLGIQSNKFQMHGWGTTDPQSTTTISTGTYYHTVFAYNQSNKKMYIWVNGVLESETTNNQTGFTGWTDSSSEKWFLGRDPLASSWTAGAGEWTPCSIKLFRQYNRVLTSAEVVQNYNSVKQILG